MEYRRFLTFNVIGGLLWAAGVTYAGYFLGSVFEHAGIEIDHVIIPIILVIILISVLPPAIHILKDKKNRTALWAGTKRELASIFGKRKK
jgi:membrane-associated protein